MAAQRRIIHGLAPDENFREAYELALKRQILMPNHLEVPPVELEPNVTFERAAA